MKKKSLGINALLNGLRNVLTVLFPLISFPYVSRILQENNLGKYNFASSIVSYFLLIAALGITTYAIREGAQYRNDKEKLHIFASEIFSINILSSAFAYLALILAIFIIPQLREYAGLLGIFSIQIAFAAIGIEWLYSIYE